MKAEHITTVYALNKKWYIVKSEHLYWSIDADWVDENGHLKRTVNGISGHARPTIAETIKDTLMTAYIRHYMDDCGKTFEEAYSLALEATGVQYHSLLLDNDKYTVDYNDELSEDEE